MATIKKETFSTETVVDVAQELEALKKEYDIVSPVDDDLVDYYFYKMISLEKKMSYLHKLAKGEVLQ